jgi:sulfite exporter TauE/SafE
MEVALIISAMVLGLAGSIHCIGMCGPLVMGMPFHNEKGKSRVAGISLYIFFKSLAYALLGILVGSIGKGFSMVLEQRLLSIISGILIIAFALVPFLKNKVQPGSRTQLFFAQWYGRILGMPVVFRFSGLGFLNGLLPCGIVYAALSAGLAIASPLQSAGFMFFFGLGTAPALISIILLQKLMAANIRVKLRKATMIVSILLGTLLVVRGMSIGIPYISPAHQHGVAQSCYAIP